MTFELRANDYAKSIENLDNSSNSRALEVHRLDGFKVKSVLVPRNTNKKEGDRLTDYRQKFVETYRPLFLQIWLSSNNRKLACDGNEYVYQMLLSDAYNMVVPLSVVSEINKLTSLAGQKIKQPKLVITKPDHTIKEEDLEIEIANSYIDKLYYSFQKSLLRAFKSSLKFGYSFMHIDASEIETKGIQIVPIDPNRCMFDISIPVNQIYEKGSSFLIEEQMNVASIRTKYGSSLEVDKAVESNVIDTDCYPYIKYKHLLINNMQILKGKTVSVKDIESYSHTKESEIREGYCKVTTMYSRVKEMKIDENGRNIPKDVIIKTIYINNIFIKTYETSFSFIPIIGLAPLEEICHIDIADKYFSVFDIIKTELLAIVTLMSGMCNSLINSLQGNILVRNNAIDPTQLNNKYIKNNLIVINQNDGTPLQDSVVQMQPANIGSGIPEMISQLYLTIQSKLNLVSSTENIDTAHQESLRNENSIKLSSDIFSELDDAVISFGKIIKEIVIWLFINMPQEINKLVAIDEEFEIDAMGILKAIKLIEDAEIKLVDGSYHSTQAENDIQKIERIFQSGIVDPKTIPIPIHVVLKRLGLSQEICKDIEKAGMRIQQQQDQVHETEILKQQLEIEKLKAEIQKIKSEYDKNEADADKKQAEAQSISKNKTSESQGSSEKKNDNKNGQKEGNSKSGADSKKSLNNNNNNNK